MFPKTTNLFPKVLSNPANSAAEASTDKAILQIIINDKVSKEIPCQFNPETLVIHKGSEWAETKQADRDAPVVKFSGGDAATFTLDLFFDTTTQGNIDVRVFTNSLLSLALRGEGRPKPGYETPPVVRFIWGKFQIFKAVLTSIDVHYILFLKNGTPVRARANCSFKQYTEDKQGQNPTSRTDPRKTYVVQQGDRLDTIAYDELGQAARWRDIAEANNLTNPLDLRPGQVLKIPQD